MWELAVMDLSSQQPVQFVGQYSLNDGTLRSLGMWGIPRMLGWLPGNQGIVLSVIVPAPDAPLQEGIYGLPFNGFTAGNSSSPFPAARLIVPPHTARVAKLSPDGTKLAYLVFYGWTPEPPGYVESGQVGADPPYTTIAVVDTATGASLGKFQAGTGLGIGDLTWTLDSQNVLFTAGQYHHTPVPVMPNIYTL
jgi:hypothetical protein